jgi:ribosomal protein S18 acetylase RimI-like enzyme
MTDAGSASTTGGEALTIRPAEVKDAAAIWAMLEPVVRAGETYALPRDMSRADALAYWTGPDRRAFVAEDAGRVVGTYYLRANQAGGGAHVCNCGYVTDPAARGRGVARAMCAHSLETARAAGFCAMQFNLVVSSNEGAIALWRNMGFAIVGRLPGAFDHPRLGFVDALVMYRRL